MSGIETQLPRESIDPWQIKRDNEVVCNILNPVAQLGAYMNRSITGIRPKDEEKVARLRQVIMPHDKIGDIPNDTLVGLAQGKMDGILSAFTGKQ